MIIPPNKACSRRRGFSRQNNSSLRFKFFSVSQMNFAPPPGCRYPAKSMRDLRTPLFNETIPNSPRPGVSKRLKRRFFVYFDALIN